MNLVLFDDQAWDNLLPLTFTRPVSDLRVGIRTIREKWEDFLGMPATVCTREHLKGKFHCASGNETLWVNGSLLPHKEMADAILKLKVESSLVADGILLAVKSKKISCDTFETGTWITGGQTYEGEATLLDYPWKIFGLNGQEITSDFERITRGRKSAALPDTINAITPENIFVEPGFRGAYVTLNASGGPIYLGSGSEIMEGAVIRGPFSLCEGSAVKMAAKIYGPTTIGPECKVGGEINNSVFQGRSNKAHDGFLGNAVIGEWCNLGADTNNSNLKNNYAEVKIWNYPKNSFVSTGLQFCGLIMGDHSKCGINTMFNTGTVVGVSANVFGSGFPRNFIPSFSWGGSGGYSTYRIEKVLETASLVMERRGRQLTAEDRAILQYIFEYTQRFRNEAG